MERLAARGARVAGAAAAFARRIAPRDAADVRALVQGAAHGRYLRSLGPEYARDVEFCAGLDTIAQAFEVRPSAALGAQRPRAWAIITAPTAPKTRSPSQPARYGFSAPLCPRACPVRSRA